MPSPTRRYYSSTAVAATLSTSLTSSATTIAISAVTGWPTAFPFTAIIGEDTNKEELVTVTGISTTTLTIVRGIGGTSGQAHDAGETIRHGVYAQDFEDASAHFAASTAVHGVSGSVVGTTDAQALTNKTISGSANSLSNIPSSAIAGVTGDIVGTTATQTLTSKTITGGTVNPTTLQQGGVQAVTISDAQTLTNKTISGSSNTLSAIPQNAIVGVSGTLVDTTSTQTLTNKTLTIPTLSSPTISSFTNANHTHGSGNGGGVLTQANTHQSPDTDTATTSLHHTIGTGAFQAAAGNHNHSTTSVPVAKIFNSADQTIANNTITIASLGGTEFNSAAWAPANIDLTNKALIAPQAGYYLLIANVAWNNNGTGRRTVWFYTGPTGTLTYSEPASASSVSATYSEVQVHTAIKYLSAGDLIKLAIFQISGASLIASATSLSATFISAA